MNDDLKSTDNDLHSGTEDAVHAEIDTTSVVPDTSISSSYTTPTFTIKTSAFEGPLDLLLNLVEKRKLFIGDISLAAVTEEYIEHINSLPEYSLKHRTQFILIASTLLLIKAKSLLPTLELTKEEEGDIKDLELRLKILELMRKKGEYIRSIFGTQQIFERGDLDETIRIFAPGKDINLESLENGISRVLNALPKVTLAPKVTVKKVISLEEMMDRLADRIQNAMKMSFREFSHSHQNAGTHKHGHHVKGSRISVVDKAERVHVIVSFLAMLELVKQGAIEVKQDTLFDEIEIEKQDIGVPKYVV